MADDNQGLVNALTDWWKRGGVAGSMGMKPAVQQMSENQSLVDALRDSGAPLADQIRAAGGNPLANALGAGNIGPMGRMMGAAEAARGPGYKVGPMGPIFDDVKDWPSAVARLKEWQRGEVPGALNHPDIGAVDVPWGSPGTGVGDGYGLSKVMAFHPDIVDHLPDVFPGMTVTSRSPNRVILESPNQKAAVSLDWHGESKQWLLTAYDREKPAPR